MQHAYREKLKPCDSNEIKTATLENKIFKMFEEVTTSEKLKTHMEVLSSEGRTGQMRLERQLRKLESKLRRLGTAKKRLLELYADGHSDRAEYAKKSAEYNNEISEVTNEKLELMQRIPLLHKRAVIDLSIAQYCDAVRIRLAQCKDFETRRQFCLDFVDHIVHYKNLVELHGYVPIRTETRDDDTPPVKIEYKITAEIEWAERYGTYMKKNGGNLISGMEFNSLVGESRRMMKDRVIPEHLA